MQVKDLKELLDNFDDNMEICYAPYIMLDNKRNFPEPNEIEDMSDVCVYDKNGVCCIQNCEVYYPCYTMIKVKYKKYYNDYRNSYETKEFSSFKELTDWLFGMAKGEYKKCMYFTSPDDEHIYDGKLKLDNSCISSYDGEWSYWVEQIEKDGIIVYSTGKFTNGICYWNEEVKQWLRTCEERMNNPKFNFG